MKSMVGVVVNLFCLSSGMGFMDGVAELGVAGVASLFLGIRW